MIYNDNRDLEWTLDMNDECRLMMREAIKFVVGKLKLPKTIKIIDIGARMGYSLDCWKEFGYNNVLGTELIQMFVDYAREQGKNVIFDDMVDSKIEGQFDLVYSRHSLEHVRHTVKAIENMIHLLKEGGCLVIIVPMESKAKFYEKRPRQKHLDYFPSMKHFKNKIINRFGLEEIVCERSENIGLKPRRDIVYIGRKNV